MTNTLAPVPSQVMKHGCFGDAKVPFIVRRAPKEDGYLLIGEIYLYSGMTRALILSNIAREIQQIDLV